MTIDTSLNQREYDKFLETTDGDTAVRTFSVMGLIKVEYDAGQVATRDTDGLPLTITYRTGGLSGTIVATVTLTYDDGCIDSWLVE